MKKGSDLQVKKKIHNGWPMSWYIPVILLNTRIKTEYYKYSCHPIKCKSKDELKDLSSIKY